MSLSKAKTDFIEEMKRLAEDETLVNGGTSLPANESFTGELLLNSDGVPERRTLTGTSKVTGRKWKIILFATNQRSDVDGKEFQGADCNAGKYVIRFLQDPKNWSAKYSTQTVIRQRSSDGSDYVAATITGFASNQ